jgi:hypothetical protein
MVDSKAPDGGEGKTPPEAPAKKAAKVKAPNRKRSVVYLVVAGLGLTLAVAGSVYLNADKADYQTVYVYAESYEIGELMTDESFTAIQVLTETVITQTVTGLIGLELTRSVDAQAWPAVSDFESPELMPIRDLDLPENLVLVSILIEPYEAPFVRISDFAPPQPVRLVAVDSHNGESNLEAHGLLVGTTENQNKLVLAVDRKYSAEVARALRSYKFVIIFDNDISGTAQPVGFLKQLADFEQRTRLIEQGIFPSGSTPDSDPVDSGLDFGSDTQNTTGG